MSEGVCDITVIGAGPVGLAAAYYAGHRDASVRIVESLGQLGGQVAAVYPEKHVYDVAGHPKIKGQDLVELCVEQGLQFGADVHLDEEVADLERLSQDGEELLALTTKSGEAVPLSRADRHCRPRRLRAEEARARRDRRLGGPRAPLLRHAQRRLQGQELRHRRRRGLRARLDARLAGHRRPADHAHPPARALPRARDFGERGARGSRGRATSASARRPRCARSTATAPSRR